MRKNQLKTYLKLGILLFGILIVLASCQKDDVILPTETYSEPRVKKISLADFTNKTQGSKNYKNLCTLFDINKNKTQNADYNRISETDAAWIITDEIMMIEREDKTFYTFRIGTDIVSDSFYNLLVVGDAMGEIESTKIFEYVPSDAWLQDTSQPFTGQMKMQENDIFSLEEVDGILFSRGSGLCQTGTRGTWECNYGEGHAPNEGTLCTEWYYTISVIYGQCPPVFTNTDTDEGVPVGPGSGGGGGGSGPGSGSEGNDSDCVPAIDNPCPEDETVVIIPPPALISYDPCRNISKLKNDDVFKQKMVDLKNAAANWGFEKLYTVKTDPTPNSSPSQTDIFDYGTFQGTIANPKVKWDSVSATTIRGIIHSHYDDLLSIFSVDDLLDMYNVIKISSVTESFFYGVVNNEGTAYILQIKDRAAFIAFGDKHFSSENKAFKFVRDYYEKKYNVKQDNSAAVNELGFVKMLEELGAGAEIFKSTDNTYSDYKKLKIENNQVVPNNCN
uniref:hypothetical protein n=1 Tax=Gelidibacter sp. TaxID=2018083 RepID=UPI0040499AC3